MSHCVDSPGLFQRVIGESGTALGDWAVTENGQAYGKALAKMVNCTSEDLDDVSKCLLEVNAEDIVSAQQKVPSLLVVCGLLCAFLFIHLFISIC